MSLPPFDRDLGSKYTRPPNPAWSWCQTIDSTPEGRAWMEGEKQGWQTIATADEHPDKVYAIMISGVVPRPIALVSSVSPTGVQNLAPFSWFGMISNHPPIVAVCCLDTPSGRLKDTSDNILSDAAAANANNPGTGFVINIISEPFVEQANAASIDAPPDVDEWTLSGLTKLPSIHVKAPRVKESAFSMECNLYQSVPILDPASGKRTTTLILGHVQYIHMRKDVLTERGTVDITKFKPVSRLGDNSYGRVGDAYKLTRPSWARDESKASEAVDKAKVPTT